MPQVAITRTAKGERSDERGSCTGSHRPAPLKASIISLTDARGLIDDAQLAPYSTALSPELFWATLVPGKWRARVICIRDTESVLGIVYLKERMVAGVGTRLMHGDSSLRSMVHASEADREDVLSTALRFVCCHMGARGVRIYIQGQGFRSQMFTHLVDHVPVEVSYSPVNRHSSLSLPDTYEIFLQHLGARTRRNFRYYRRRFEAARHSYLENLSLAEFRGISRELSGRSRISVPGSLVDQTAAVLKAADRPLIAGLRAADGRWLSILAGWREGDKATLFSQSNRDLDHARDSLAMVLRGYFLESLIMSGVHTLDFWWGTAGALAPYVELIPTVNVHIDSTAPGWQLLRRSLAWLNTRSVGAVPEFCKWIVPPAV